MKRILFLTPYPKNTAPSQRLKFEQYYSEIEKEGYDITLNSFMNKQLWKIVYSDNNYTKKITLTIYAYFKRWLSLFSIYKFDIVYVHLWGTPLGLPIYEWILKRVSAKLIYDIDDLVFLGRTSQVNSITNKFKGSQKVNYLIKNADYVITCTPFLDQYARKLNTNTSDISSTVNTETKYKFKNAYELNNTEIKLGWSGSHSTSKYLYLLENVLKRISNEINFKLIVMGDQSFKIEGVNIQAVEWSPDYEMDILNSFDIGLYPLPDEKWIYGKSGLKAIQYQALGIPVVASDLGVNSRVIINKETGFLVPWDSEEEWYLKIKELIESFDLRKKMGIRGRKHIVTNFSVSSTKYRYIEIFNQVLSQ